MVLEIRSHLGRKGLGEGEIEMGEEQERLFWGAGKGPYLSLVGNYMGKNSSCTLRLEDFTYFIYVIPREK